MTEIDPTVYAIPGFLLLLGGEWWLLRTGRTQRGRPYERRDARASLSMGAGILVIGLGIRFVQASVGGFLWDHRITDLGTGAAAWIAVMLLWDLLFYWDHRWRHEVRVLWASHVNHHSSEHYNLSTALRQEWSPWLELLLYPALCLLGFRPEMVLVAGSLNLIYQFWIHTEVVDRIGPLEWVLNSPSHHRVHHGSNPRYLDKNYGGILIVWDRLFGTFEAESERVRYGITKNISTFNPLRIASHEYAAMGRDLRGASSWRERFGYVVRHPGWAPAPPVATGPRPAVAANPGA